VDTSIWQRVFVPRDLLTVLLQDSPLRFLFGPQQLQFTLPDSAGPSYARVELRKADPLAFFGFSYDLFFSSMLNLLGPMKATSETVRRLTADLATVTGQTAVRLGRTVYFSGQATPTSVVTAVGNVLISDVFKDTLSAYLLNQQEWTLETVGRLMGLCEGVASMTLSSLRMIWLCGNWWVTPALDSVDFERRGPEAETHLYIAGQNADGLSEPPKVPLGGSVVFTVSAKNLDSENAIWNPVCALDIWAPSGSDVSAAPMKMDNTETPVADTSEGGTGQVGGIRFHGAFTNWRCMAPGETEVFETQPYVIQVGSRRDDAGAPLRYWADARPFYVEYAIWHNGYPGQKSPAGIESRLLFTPKRVPFYIVDGTPPRAPLDLRVESSPIPGGRLVVLRWRPPAARNVAPQDKTDWDVVKYRVYRDGQIVLEVQANHPLDDDMTICQVPEYGWANGWESHTYCVTAIDTNPLESPFSEPVTLRAQTWLSVPDVVAARSGSTVKLFAQLSSGNGFLQDRTLRYYVDGSLVGSALTNTLGIAYFPYVVPTMPDGTYKMKMALRVVWEGDDVSMPAESSATIHVGIPTIECRFESLTRDADGKLRLRVRLKNTGTAESGNVTIRTATVTDLSGTRATASAYDVPRQTLPIGVDMSVRIEFVFPSIAPPGRAARFDLLLTYDPGLKTQFGLRQQLP